MEMIPKEQIQTASEGLKAIAHEVRLSVLCHLMDGPLCVHDLIERTGSSQSNLSQHLSKMRMMGILNHEKRGQQVYYSIANPQFETLLQALQNIYCPDVCSR
ncbi:ArsR/SmtB family transcription factor [Ghiorsea bivora]|uniref:ArsR/SmtB family transcription factor n=1 Tax=Ghiorsea bivora TaxID=1485545 RepID=UPI0018E0C132|nr:metalloregulator ArsR/SmtB family transcription factor [Ghiorsea bivora]